MKRLKNVLDSIKVITMTLGLIGVGMAIISTSLAILAIPEISVIAISLVAAVIPSAIQTALPAVGRMIASIGATLVGSATFFIIPTLLKPEFA